MSSDYKIRPDCRLCGGSYQEVLRFDHTPLANEYPATAEEALNQDKFPLYLVQCDECGHFQLPVVVNPERLFRNYAYTSGTSPVFREHLRQLAADTHPGPGQLVVDIASNDGTLLKEYKRHGCEVVGVDPALNLAEKANAEGVYTIPEFFDADVARRIRAEKGTAILITALNVMAHVDDLHGIVEGVKELLSDDGTFIFEVGYFPEVCRLGMFDTIYHEHLSYHHLYPLTVFFGRHGMHIERFGHNVSQGGSLRCHVKSGPYHRAPSFAIPTKEFSVPDIDNLRVKIDTTREWVDWYDQISGGTVVYGCPAKLTTFMNATHCFPPRAFDDNPLKVGRFLPGTLTEIERFEGDDFNHEELLIPSWNFADDIMSRLRGKGYKGKFIVPLPELRVYK